ncbi:MAG: 3-dehydroquinate synthase [Chloroflexi bacterium]|nr:3-dehydroquinate synthase [Chloroflexota bacterium]
MSNRSLILVGMSGSGKSAAGAIVARRLGLPLLDTDDRIVAAAGRPIDRIFAEDGEPHFRQLERQAVADACAQGSAVIVTGGGAMAQPETRAILLQSGFLVCLEASVETLIARISADHATDDPTKRRPLFPELRERKTQRQEFYAQAHWTVHTDRLTVDEVADEAVRAWGRYARRWPSDESAAFEGDSQTALASVVTTETQSYPVYVEAGGLSRLGERMRGAGLSGGATIIADRNVAGSYGETALASLADAGFAADLHVIDAGEPAKNLDTVARLYDHLLERRAERSHTLVALGGGVTGDLVGFVAATYLRGVPFVQAPTSLLGMVDAGIGGKTGVNRPQGKNLVGAFYQPRLVLADTDTLKSLPQRALTEGWAEAIKHALILDPALLATFEREADRLLRLEPDITAAVVRRSTAIKAEVVSQDEKEIGLRMILNYGHTIGHALENVTGYGRLLHGEAVAVGMRGAAQLSQAMGLLTAEDVERQQAVLRRFGLPETAPGADADAVLAALLLDKKVKAKTVRWVLLDGLGRAVVRNDVPPELVERTVRELVQ